jgi:hypothetical protein
MKTTGIVLPIIVSFLFVGCASTKYKAFSTPTNFKSAASLAQGKTPKETAQILGKPMSAFFKNGDVSEYHMVYPMAEKEVSVADIMFNDRMECLELIFEKNKGYKFDNWSSNTGFTCGAIKGEKLDMSLIEN